MGDFWGAFFGAIAGCILIAALCVTVGKGGDNE
jgi:hypothetical protein